MRTCLTIAGSDPSGGAGVQADLKTFHQHGTYGMSVLTLLTVQSTKTVEEVKVLDPDFVLKQLKTVIEDIPPHAAKTGALGKAEIVDALCGRATKFDFPLVIDPVMVSKHGSPLLDGDGVELIRRRLLRVAHVVTPNVPEARLLSERDIDSVSGMERAAQTIAKLGVRHVLVKGGHLDDDAVDVLWTDGVMHRFPAKRMTTTHTHGTGCVLSAAITARIAFGESVLDAVAGAKQFVTRAIESAPGLGRGFGPINVHAAVPAIVPRRR